MKPLFNSIMAVVALVLLSDMSFAQTWSLTGNAATDPAVNFIGTTDNKSLKFKTNNYVRMTILSNGKLGIGIGTPIWKLDVKGGSINTDSVYRINGLQVLAANNGLVQLGSGTSFVGVGTANPAAPLHVSTTNQEAFRLTGGTSQFNSTGMYMTFYENTNYRGYIGSFAGASADMDFGTGGGNTTGSVHLVISAAPRFTLNSSGNVGIGTTTPVSRLSLVQTGTSSPTFELTNTSKGPNISYGHFGATGDWYLRSAANAGSVILQDQSAGVVGVGTTYVPAGYKMSVNGKVICTELKVQLLASWPDYVFTPEYKLMNLSDLSNFIHANGHLPGIPSADEVNGAAGVEVGEMQRVLVEKIEELTLYILKQEDKIQQLQQAVEQLKK